MPFRTSLSNGCLYLTGFSLRLVALLKQEAESVAAVTCLSLFTRFERLSLERIVGEERAGHMLASTKNTFLFC